ncbi:LssY C-terminal domain-containing protein [Candidatus Binatus sp.]|uniref:LssY C-terminal domain-containing protein n=1 Tax=Candidatus Binatus sp. TaxID=2811406 RepID=UPI003BB10D38
MAESSTKSERKSEIFSPRRWLTVDYSPHPEERSFMQRAQTLSDSEVAASVAVPSDRESERIFGVRLARHRVQAVWLEVVNGGHEPLWLDRVQLDPDYYTPLEAAHLAHFAMGTRLLAFGVIGWLFLPLLPLVPLKLLSARAANGRMRELFRTLGFPTAIILPGKKVGGFIFTRLDEGVKRIDVRLLGRNHVADFQFTVEVPGLTLPHPAEDAEAAGGAEQLDEAALRTWIERQPRCTGNEADTVEGDPLNLVIVGDRASIQECLSTWDETESITLGTSWKTAKAFLLESQYRYSPVSPLYLGGRQQEFALQRARASLNERLHLRLWSTKIRFEGEPVWIGQVSRDIGVRFTPKTWNLTTHQIDPNVDEARDYVLDDLLASRRVALMGFVHGVQPAPADAPRHNLTGDPYFTDGLRAFAVLSRTRTAPSLLS